LQRYISQSKALFARWVTLVTARTPNDQLFRALEDKAEGNPLPFTLSRIGDCEAPAIIASAVYAGHRYAEELERESDADGPFKHNRIDVGPVDLDRHSAEHGK
jgi:dimethylamine/trimethylamine dehydrogenase